MNKCKQNAASVTCTQMSCARQCSTSPCWTLVLCIGFRLFQKARKDERERESKSEHLWPSDVCSTASQKTCPARRTSRECRMRFDWSLYDIVRLSSMSIVTYKSIFFFILSGLRPCRSWDRCSSHTTSQSMTHPELNENQQIQFVFPLPDPSQA